jgi:hypothetical protein
LSQDDDLVFGSPGGMAAFLKLKKIPNLHPSPDEVDQERKRRHEKIEDGDANDWRNDFEAKQWNWWRTVARIRYRDPRKINSFLVHGLSRGFRWYGDDRADNELRVAIGSGAVKAFDASGNKISQLARLARDPEIYFEAVAIRTSWPSAHVIDDLNVAQHPKRNYLKQRNRGPNLKKRAAALKALKSKLQSGKITEDDLQGAKPWKTIAGELGVGRTLARQLAEQVLAQKIPRAASRGSRRGADK